MERRRRRLWIWLVSALAIGAIIAGTLSAAFAFAVNAVPGYRSKVEAMVGKAAGHPVRIGAMALVWHRLRPEIQFDDIALLDHENGTPLLHAQRVHIGFSLSRLIVADWMPSRAEITGLALRADIDKVGHWTLQGFDLSQPAAGDNSAAMEQMSKLLRISLRDCSLEIHDKVLGEPSLLFKLRNAELRHRDQHFDVQAIIDPPASLAQRADLHGAFDGDLTQLQSFGGRWVISVDQLHGWPWLAKDLPEGVQLQMDGAQLTLDGRAQAGRVTEIEVQAEARSIVAKQDEKALAQLAQFQLSAIAQPTADCWQATLNKLEMSGVRGAWSASKGHYECAQTGDRIGFAASVDHLRLDDLAPWLALYKALPASAARVRDVQGDVHDLRIETHPPEPSANADGGAAPRTPFHVEAALEGAGLGGSAEQAGFSGLSGALIADNDHASLHLDNTPLSMNLPGLFDAPLPIDALSADVDVQRENDVWHVVIPKLDAHAQGAVADGSLDLKLPATDGASKEIALLLNFSAPDVLPLKPFIPNNWGPKTKEWLTRAVVHGKVPKGTLELCGPLADYPFIEHPTGRWALDLEVADGTLQFSPDWPAAEQVHANLKFRGHGMAIAVDRAQLSGNAVDKVDAEIADFRESDLLIDGSVHGDATKFYEVVRASPIHARLSGLVDKTEASGPVKLDLHLDLPLKVEPLEVHATGDVTASSAELHVRGLDEPLREINGVVAFGAKGLSAESLNAKFYEAALKARIAPMPAAPEGVLDVNTVVSVEPADGVAAAFVPQWIRERLAGNAAVRARLPFGGPESGHLLITSDLKGLTSNLPLPLDKAASAMLPLAVQVGSDGPVPLRVNVEVADVLRVGVRFADDSSGKLESRAVQVQFGNGDMPRTETDGLTIAGAPEVLDVAPWMQLLQGIGGNARAVDDQPLVEGIGKAADNGTTSQHPQTARSLAFVSVDLLPKHLLLHGGSISQPHLRATPAGEGYRVTLEGASAQGVIDWTPADNGHLVARLDHVVFDPVPVATSASTPNPDAENKSLVSAAMNATGKSTEKTSAPFEPNRAPTFDVDCARIAIGDINLGRMLMLTSRVPEGQHLDSLQLSGGALGIDAHGAWLRMGAKSNADFDFQIRSPDIGPVLTAFGYAETVDAKQAAFNGTLAWPSNADGLSLADAVGLVQLDVKNGVLKTVKPGAGRVLGLLNLYALPRRLLFDFRDVVSKGLAFDSIKGKFSLANGQAYTSDMEIKSPSLKLEMRGRIGLAAHDYDQHITVYPDVTTGVTIGAGIAGGPVGALIALVAQEALGKPFNFLSQFSYHVTGPWDNPVVKHGKDDSPPGNEAPADGSSAPDPAAAPASTPATSEVPPQ